MNAPGHYAAGTGSALRAATDSSTGPECAEGLRRRCGRRSPGDRHRHDLWSEATPRNAHLKDIADVETVRVAMVAHVEASRSRVLLVTAEGQCSTDIVYTIF